MTPITGLRDNMLNELGRKYRCDKVDQWHTFRGETYLDIYEKYFNNLKDKDLVFLELGVRVGASLSVWQDYFPNGKIIGIDIDPRCKQFEKNNIKIETGSQGDEDFLQFIIKKYGPFDIILDDASHINDLTLKSFYHLADHVKEEGGMYVIEDLRNSYEDLRVQARTWPGMSLNDTSINYNNLETRKKIDDMILSSIRDMDYMREKWRGIHFHSQMVLFQR
jgi:hypothetical protein